MGFGKLYTEVVTYRGRYNQVMCTKYGSGWPVCIKCINSNSVRVTLSIHIFAHLFGPWEHGR